MREDETRPLTDDELEEITASSSNPSAELEEARKVLRSALSESWKRDGLESLSVAALVRRLEKRLSASEEETRRLQFLIRRLHDFVSAVPGAAQDLRAELAREVEGMIRKGG